MTTPAFDEAFWNDLYGDAPLWSGRPNPQLVAVVSEAGGAEGQPGPLRAGSALDVGSGEGGDALWLARHGWQVTGVDLSTVALERAQDAAAHHPESAARITWQQVDLLRWTPPEAAFDLVSSHYMHLPSRDMRVLVAGLAAAVRPGGTLLVVGHDGVDHRHEAAPVEAAPTAGVGAPASHGVARAHQESQGPAFDPDLFWTAQSLAELLPAAEWEILVAESLPHPTRPGDDAVLHARRR